MSSFTLAPAVFVSCASFVCLSACLSLLLRAPAHAQPSTLVGNYQASAAAIRSEVSAWGVDCGVQPQSYTASERPLVSLSLQGSHLVLSYPDRRLRTDLCWSPNPLVKLASATAADNRWRAECRTPRGEAKQEVGRYTVTATGPYTLELVEESDYDWQLKGSHCVASVRITQMLERVPQERAAPVAAAQPTATPGTKTPAAAPCVAGALTRLRIRPSEARIEPGQRVCFTVQGMDATGCAADVEMTRVRWELKKPDAARAQLGDGCFRAAASAADAEGSFRVSAIHEGLRAEASVSVLAPDLSDITARRGATTAAEGPALAAEPTARGMEDAGVQTAAVKRRDPTLLWLGIGALGLALLGAGLFIVMRLRAKPAPARKSSLPMAAPRDPVSRPPGASAPTPIAQPAPVTSVEARPLAIAVPAPAAMSLGSSEQLICPTCRRGYAPGAQRCEGDGSALVPYAEFVRRAKEAETTSTACPGCGAKLAAASVFCGGCGRKLTS